jgi:2-keto-3-deoxy-L-rhamnonate aldolase RhmA
MALPGSDCGRRSPHPTCEICAGAGFDWLLIDAEHAPRLLVLAQLQAGSLSGGAGGAPADR